MNAPEASESQGTGTVAFTEVLWEDRRRNERLAIFLPVRIRPFDPKYSDLEEVRSTLNFSRDGLYFITQLDHYSLGMRVLVTFPHSPQASARRKFLGKVTRLEEFPSGSRGVAVQFVF